MAVDAAIGVLKDNHVIGVAVFQNFNGHNIEFSYYGTNTLTLGSVRWFARFGLNVFNPMRCTITTSQANKRILQFLSAMGASYEGLMKDYYGSDGTKASTAVRFCISRPLIEKLARVEGRTVAWV
jgi:hypothetical protein